MRPKVTVVIPAYNMEKFVERTLKSAIAQTYVNLDIIVVDDGSTDATRTIVETIAAEHSNVRVISTPNGGVAEARNLGTRMAESLYVAYLDGDDLWHATKVERQVEALAAHGHSQEWAACYSYFRVIDADDRLLGDGMPAEYRGDFFAAHMTCNPIGNGSNLLVRRDAALAVGGFNPGYAAAGIGGCEDVEFQLKLLRRYKIEVMPEYLLGYRIHARQMSGNIARMRLGEIAVMETCTADSGVPLGVRNRGLVHAYLEAAKGFVRLGEWSNAFRHLSRSLRRSLSETLVQLASHGRFEALYWGQRSLAALSRKPDRSHLGKRFGEVGPLEGCDDSWGVSAQYRWTLFAGGRNLTSQ